MKFKMLAVLIPVLLTGYSLQASSQDYQSFSNVNYTSVDDGNFESNKISINSQYFFEGRPSLGPFNQFEYINKITNISAIYQYENSETDVWDWPDKFSSISKNTNNTVGIGGEWFSGNLLLGGSYSYVDSDHTRQTVEDTFSYKRDAFILSAGYLLSDDLLVKVNMNNFENIDNYFTVSASYNWQLGDVDYVGFTYSTDEYLDFHNLSAKYFMALADESYLVLGAGYVYDNSGGYEDNRWNADVSYYFNTKTSLSANYNDKDTHGVAVNHFINENYAIGAYYTSNNLKNDFNIYGINFTAQF